MALNLVIKKIKQGICQRNIIRTNDLRSKPTSCIARKNASVFPPVGRVLGLDGTAEAVLA
jgi:hypothetical protein